MWKSVYILSLCYCIANAVIYNTYKRAPATDEEIEQFKAKKNLETCTIAFEPCDENEWRRIDGSCNNLDYPSHGTFYTPEIRMLPANYSEGFTLRKMSSGKDFPLARYVRLMALKVGDGIDSKFATSATYFPEFLFADIGSIHDVENYVLQTDCCISKALDNPMCTPNLIPVNDNVHRFSGYDCINMTRPKTFQTEGCAPSTTVPARIAKATTHFDLSSTYLHANASAIKDHRTYEGGRLKVEVVNGIALPTAAVEGTTCFVKQAKETGCVRNVPNTILSTHMYSTWFWRYHNLVADALAEQNPCWDDEKLFHIALDINIAHYVQIKLYEYFSEVLGRESLIEMGILHSDDGFRDPYDKTLPPGVFMEYNYCLRWFHGTQDGMQELYNQYGDFLGTTQMVNFSLRVEHLAYDDNMPRITNGFYRQAAGAFNDFTVHPDLVDNGLGFHLQKVLDILSNDLAKGRYFGFTSYLQYRDFCTNYEKKHETFEDLSYLMDQEKIDELRRIYGNPWDIELMAGMWSENKMEGAWVPPTVHCLLSHQLKRTVMTDRHWYERPNRPYAYTAAQLNEIRKSSLAEMLCAVGDNVLEVQPKAFLRIGPGNELVDCSEIPKLDFSVWKDESCKYE
ncbi:peroxidase [Manduca sexta]|uniref:Peroxidase-like n=1 Tax=Manduca sexta TaxID=7130 RepID=A0A921ZHH2_MANSE|nr:peroxidase [Manduca sexta]KAG6457889.1 hypothetical protein O3G_MSEX010555 [Manduca sexta]